MVTHLSTVNANGCLTLLIPPFSLTTLTFGLCWYCALLRYLTWGSHYPFVKKLKFIAQKVKVHCSPILEMDDICTIPTQAKS